MHVGIENLPHKDATSSKDPVRTRRGGLTTSSDERKNEQIHCGTVNQSECKLKSMTYHTRMRHQTKIRLKESRTHTQYECQTK